MSESTDGDLLRMVRDSAADFISRTDVSANVRAWRGKEDGFDRARWSEMAGLGWTGLLIAGTFGGAGLGVTAACALMAEIGRGIGPEPLTAVGVLAAQAIAGGDGHTAQKRLLPAIADGSAVIAVGWQERAGSLSAGDVQMLASPQTDGSYSLSGTKDFVHAAPSADGFVFSARSKEGVGLFYTPREAAGLEITPAFFTDGSAYGRIVLDNVIITADNIVGSPAVGEGALEAALDVTRVVLSAELLGLMRRAFDITLDYLRQRQQFGKPVGAFQALQHRAVDLYVALELTRSAVDRAARILDAEDEPVTRALEGAACKARASDTALLLAREVIQMHGAIGYTDEHIIGLYVRRALVLSAWLGNGGQNRKRYAVLSPAPDQV